MSSALSTRARGTDGSGRSRTPASTSPPRSRRRGVHPGWRRPPRPARGSSARFALSISSRSGTSSIATAIGARPPIAIANQFDSHHDQEAVAASRIAIACVHALAVQRLLAAVQPEQTCHLGVGLVVGPRLVARVTRLLAGHDEREHGVVDGVGQRHRVALLQLGRRLELAALLDRDACAMRRACRAPPCRCGAGARRHPRSRCGRRGGCRSPPRCTPTCTSAPSPARRGVRCRRGPVTRWRSRVLRSCGERRPIPSETCRSTRRADDHVVTITIDRPARRNALDMEHFDALADAWKSFRDDGDAWVAVVTGVDDAFCAGGDLRDYLPLLTARGERATRGTRRFRSGTEAVLRDLPVYKPIIAAVNGPCVAGGMELLNGTDIRIVCPEAVFGMVEPKRGHLRQRRHERAPAPADPVGGGDGVPPHRRAGAGDARAGDGVAQRDRAAGAPARPRGTNGRRGSPRTRRWPSPPPRRVRCAGWRPSRSPRR